MLGTGCIRPLIAGIALVVLAGCGGAAPAAIEGAWVRLPAVPGRPAAAYFEFRAGAEAATLVAASTPAAVRAELHESIASSGVMTMRAVPQVAVQAGGSVSFAPRGKHVMLYDVSPALKPGDTVPLTIAFADGKSLTANAKVFGPADTPPTGEGRP